MPLLDGGLATELERRGANLRDALWSARLLIENPDLIRQVHEDYFRAGADVATSASYQASFLGFARRGIAPKQAVELLRMSVRLAQDARDRVAPGKHVAASLGCYGAALADGSEYRGDYNLSVDELVDWHRPRFETLADTGPEWLAWETIPCLAETEAIARLLDSSHDRPSWISFCCRDESRLASGESLIEAIQIAAQSADMVGVNCVSPNAADRLIATIRSATDKPIVVYPNAGGEWDADSKTWRGPDEPFDWIAAAKRWRDAGATWIGGCCRTTPDTIRQMRSALGDAE